MLSSKHLKIIGLKKCSYVKENINKLLYNVRLFSSETPHVSGVGSTVYHSVVPPSSNDQMLAWKVKSFGSLDNLELSTVRIPIIKKPKEVLINVKATSVNPLDVAMLGGYGNVMLSAIRQFDPDSTEVTGLPMILGRDFAGEVIAKGNKVRPDIMIGDTVYGVVPPHLQGCHAQQVVADENMLCRKPEDLSINEAAGILFTGMTAWSALHVTGDLYMTSAKKKRVLVIGASGGVGTLAVQLLKAWEAEVIGTCRTDAVDMVKGLQADHVIDYTSKDALQEIGRAGKYDIILDASGAVNPTSYIPFLKEWSNAKFITLRPPMLKNTDNHGLMFGMVRNVADIVMSNVTSGAPSKGSSVRWGFFMPIPTGVKEIANLVAQKKITPVVHRVYDFSELPIAYDTMSQGHVRGKIIISVDKD